MRVYMSRTACCADSERGPVSIFGRRNALGAAVPPLAEFAGHTSTTSTTTYRLLMHFDGICRDGMDRYSASLNPEAGPGVSLWRRYTAS